MVNVQEKEIGAENSFVYIAHGPFVTAISWSNARDRNFNTGQEPFRRNLHDYDTHILRTYLPVKFH